MEDVATWVPIFGVLLASVALVFTAMQLRAQRILSRQEKTADVLLQLHDRFQEIARLRTKLKAKDLPGDHRAIRDFYYQYWAHQLNQWQFFRLGLLPVEIYTRFLMHVADSLRGFEKIGDVDARQGWQTHGRMTMRHQPDFRRFIDEIAEFSAGNVPAEQMVSPERGLYEVLLRLAQAEFKRHRALRREFGKDR